MGLDMRPMGKPKPGCEARFDEIFRILEGKQTQKLSLFDRLLGRKALSEDDLLEEWYEIQIPSYETIKAPKVGRDEQADEWVIQKYRETNAEKSEALFIMEHDGYYVIELAKETDGVPMYSAFGQDENVFRGQFLSDCISLIGEDLVNEAWETKLAPETLAYGQRLMVVADRVASENNLEYLKTQRMPPDVDEDSLESKLHIVYSLAKWLIFYGSNDCFINIIIRIKLFNSFENDRVMRNYQIAIFSYGIVNNRFCYIQTQQCTCTFRLLLTSD
jgi:hypothetical protein